MREKSAPKKQKGVSLLHLT